LWPVVCLKPGLNLTYIVINLSIPGYEFIYVTSDNRAGGVAKCVSNKFRFEITNQFDLECKDTKIRA